MARLMTSDDESDFAENIKTLDDDELLDVWVKTQQMEISMREQYPQAMPALNYEALIIQELQQRRFVSGKMERQALTRRGDMREFFK